MKIKYAIAAIAATTMMSGAALADGPNKQSNRNSASTVTGGVAAAGNDGAVAGGIAAGQATSVQKSKHKNRKDRRAMRRSQASQASPAQSASTSTSGAVYTDRNSGSAAINTNGSAAGSGTVRSSSEGEVYSSTTRDGSDADAYGVSEAEAREPRDPQL